MRSYAALVLVLVASAGGAPQPQDDLAYTEETTEETAIHSGDVQLISTPESLVLREGDNISLPCRLEGEYEPDSVITLWRKEPDTILYTGHLKVSVTERTQLGPNNELIIPEATADDSGAYTCVVTITPERIELRHTVSVQWPAKLRPLDSDHFQIHEGESFELTCGANGNPKPDITWSKMPTDDAEGPYVDNGELVVATPSVPEGDDMAFMPEGPSQEAVLTMDPVEPRHTGTYTCTAQNHIGQPDVLTAKLEVLHAPYISLESVVVRTAHGMRTEIGCKIFANPRAEVFWQRNGEDLPVSSRYETTVSSRYFSLVITDVKDEDFGNYTCRAKNELGQNENHITLTGLPGPMDVHLGQPQKLPSGQYSMAVTWEFISFSTVEETYVTLQPRDPAGFPEVRQIPIVTSQSVSKRGERRLSPLNENTTYEVKVWAQNQYGKTPTAEVFFSIIDGEVVMQKSVPHLAESKTSGGEAAGRLKLTAILLIAILSSFF